MNGSLEWESLVETFGEQGSQKPQMNPRVENQIPQQVLVVDNDSTERSRSAMHLRERYGDHPAIRHATSVRGAIHALEEQAADLILLDWRVPQETDLAPAEDARLLLEILMAIHHVARDAAIVVYSTGIDEPQAVAALRAGAVECLDKPAGTELGRRVAMAMERHRQHQLLESARREAAHRATHDPLTGLATRDLFLEQLEQTLALNARHGRRTGLLFVDLDGFKAVNDTRGHQQGDVLLCAVADRLRSCVRRSDSVARLGGDEFVLLVPDAGGNEAIDALGTHLKSLLQQPVPMQDGPPVSPGASIGCAVAPRDGETPAALLAAADRAMYRAKAGSHRGRRRRRRDARIGDQWSVSGSNR